MARRKKARKKTARKKTRRKHGRVASKGSAISKLLKKIKNAPAGVRRDIKKHLGV